MLKLFYAPGACSLASHIVLEETGANFEAIRLDLSGGEQARDAYLAINPHGRVPALATDQGVLTESPAILAYLADAHPALELLPRDPFERAQAGARMSWLASHLHIAVAHVWRPRRYTDDPGADEGMKAKALTAIAAGFALIEDSLKGRDWFGARYSVVDPYLLVFRRWGARLGLDMSAYPAFVAHGDRVAARPAAQRALAREGIRIDG
jgi:glutathione S-transferase